MIKVRFAILFIWFAMPASGQLYSLDLKTSENKIITHWLHVQPVRQDSLMWVLSRNILFHSLHEDGFLLADLGEWKFQKDTLHMYVDPGAQIRWAKISFKALEFLPSRWVQDLDVSGKVVDYNGWNNTVRSVLKNAQNEGYLFADYRLTILELKDDSLHGEIIFNPGLKIVLDTIEIQGTGKLSTQYLQKSLGLKKGQPVTPNDLSNLRQQLNNLRFVQQVSPPVLILNQEKAAIRVYLNNRNASSFDVLAGLQPSPLNNNSLTITGYVKLDLVNQLQHGERMYINLEKLRPRSQKLNLSLSFPYLLDLPFGIDVAFNLFKNDTLYSELEWKAGISLPFGKNQYIRAALSEHATNLISVDKNSIISSKNLPVYIDLRIKGLTFELYRNRLDFDLNPRKGYSLNLSSTFSQKHVIPNTSITGLSDIDPSFDYSSLYDSLRGNSTRVSVESVLKYFVPIGSQSTLLMAADAGALKSGSKLYDNELYRLGGYARLRGFDEESVLAQYFSIFTAEYRLIIGGGSYISVFSDLALIRNNDVEIPVKERAVGFGIGLDLETKAGIFGIRAAVGAAQNNPIDFGKARIHFGYVNRF